MVAPSCSEIESLLHGRARFYSTWYVAGVIVHVDGLASEFHHSDSDGDDAIFGDLGNDWIVGGTGRDHICGGFGNDLMNGDEVSPNKRFCIDSQPEQANPLQQGQRDGVAIAAIRRAAEHRVPITLGQPR